MAFHAASASLRAAPDAPEAARWLGVGLLVVGAFLALSGVLFVAGTWPFVYGPQLVFFVAAVVVVAGGIGVLRGERWAWGVAWGVVAAGVFYAVWGLMRGYGSGLIGLSLWGGVAYALLRRDVRAHCAVGW